MTYTQFGEPVEVRPAEQLDWASLERYLGNELGLEGPLTVLQFPNGAANLTYRITMGERVLVVRRPPFGELAPGAHDMAREYRVLSRLWEAYDRAPRALLLCRDHDVIGADFLVSEFRSGQMVWSTLPPEMAGIPDAAHALGRAVVDALADLHSVDADECGLGSLGRPIGFLERQLSGWTDRWKRVATEDIDDAMGAIAGALARSLPASGRPGIIHNDFKIDNCQFPVGDPTRVSTVFDWDMCTLGDTLVDLGILLNYWPDPSDTEADHSCHFPGLERLGLPTRSEVKAQYCSRTGVDVQQIAWYEAYAIWKTVIVREQLHHRFLVGKSADPRMATLHDDSPMLAQRARRILKI
jgi:aminoglycoside phosphotransferase (APT) family kinase protein